MAIVIQTQQIVRKHALLMKESRGEKLTNSEEKEIVDIEECLKNIREELLQLHSDGIKLVNGNPEEIAKIEKAKMPKMTPADRRVRALALVKDMKEKGDDDKTIMVAISAELGVSNTYGYKLLKEM